MALQQSVTKPVLNEQHTRHRLQLSNKPNLTYVVSETNIILPSRPFGKCRLIDLVLCLAYELLPTCSVACTFHQPYVTTTNNLNS
jgi:hypothetical protein